VIANNSKPIARDPLHLLGLVEYQSGHPTRAAALIGKALDLQPDNAIAWCNLASALRALQQFYAALAGYERAIICWSCPLDRILRDPSMTIYRQTTTGDWHGVVHRVRAGPGQLLGAR